MLLALAGLLCASTGLSAWAADVAPAQAPPAQACPRLVSTPIQRKSNQATAWNIRGTCDFNLKDEQERQSTQAQLECLMGGWEDAVDFKISCKRFMAYKDGRKIPALHYEYSWRCARFQCK